ncbi:YesL family protein [Pseudoflavonifractor phocaeensis]|uniref:YesL family protein n=1 Tax=Pseudoflavonifractor phocaeensis TaxID=1870988 RepID=UPI00195B4180|nr:YesL family protein [Pseudoflavonifractor phocaeensis]MBM6924488.1 YesL family protein [Pseudoflavonifractor phocaeensis]
MGIFNPDLWFYRITEKIVDILLLSVFWLACSLPVVTLGPATAALYHTVVRCLRGNQRNSWGVFFQTFRANLKVGVLTTLVVIPVAVALVFIQGVLYQGTAVSQAGGVIYYAFLVFSLLPIGIGCYLFPVLSRFTFQVSGLLVNCCKLAIANLPWTVLIGLIFYAAVVICSVLYVLIFVMPVIVAWLHSLILERIFKPYIDAQRAGEENGETE